MTMTLVQRSRSLHRLTLRPRSSLPKPSFLCSPASSVVEDIQTWDRSLPIARHFATGTRRRKRSSFGKAKIEGNGPPRVLPEVTGLDQPYAYGGEDGESTEEYQKKTSLSPWVPIPDPIARKLFDMSAPTPDDIHVELGCGDGRVNFFAIDHGKVKKSTGIDIDDGIMKQARERLSKRYPQPPIEFITADLLDYNNHQVWEKIQEATIITMYFVEDALQKIRPLLEEKLAGKQCKIITCAYAMPGWTYTTFETTLGTTCYLYNWGNMDDEDTTSFFSDDNILTDKPKELTEDPFEKMHGFDKSKVEHVPLSFPDRSVPDPNDYWTDEEDEEDDSEKEDEASEDSKGGTRKSPPCSSR